MGNIARLANQTLRPLGLRVIRQRPIVELRQYEALIGELVSLYRATTSPTLPEDPGRSRLLAKLLGTNISEALYLLDAIHKTRNLPGAVCEFGVAQGATSALIANEIMTSDKELWLFDSFQGLSKPSAEDVLLNDIAGLGSMDRYEGLMKSPIAEVRSRLADVGFPTQRVKIVAGFIEDTIRTADLPPVISCAYVDFDFYNPTRTVLRLLSERLVPGGQIVVDDYGWFSAGVKTAVQEFLISDGIAFEPVVPPSFAGHFVLLKRR